MDGTEAGMMDGKGFAIPPQVVNVPSFTFSNLFLFFILYQFHHIFLFTHSSLFTMQIFSPHMTRAYYISLKQVPVSAGQREKSGL